MESEPRKGIETRYTSIGMYNLVVRGSRMARGFGLGGDFGYKVIV